MHHKSHNRKLMRWRRPTIIFTYAAPGYFYPIASILGFCITCMIIYFIMSLCIFYPEKTNTNTQNEQLKK